MYDSRLPRIPVPNDQARAWAQRLLDKKCKPRGSLGRLEELATHLAAIRGTTDLLQPTKAVVVMAGDHGVAERGVSAYPQEVTGQMLLNFAAGGAAVNVLARAAGAEVVTVDMGVASTVEHPRIQVCRIGPGTRDFLDEPAMSGEQAERAVSYGVELAHQLIDRGISLIALGDMGIGNTTSASALTAVLADVPVSQVSGRGTGIDDAALQRKVEIIEAAMARSGATSADPWHALRELGGFEIAGLAGLALGAAAQRVPVVLDGFITGAAALVAAALNPDVRSYYIAAHRSAEPGHHVVLQALHLRPLLELDLRLGEGSGAALALPIIDAAVRILREMATFTGAGVTDSGA